ncbi:hypothetical protein QVA66_09960 [Staphylococcus chromogenes]|nr:hypothetical protein [Staphylococcus chromogenes]
MAVAWELPEGVLPISLVDGSASSFVALNRNRKEFPPNSVLFVDAEIKDIVCLADDFESFISQLGKNPYV